MLNIFIVELLEVYSRTASSIRPEAFYHADRGLRLNPGTGSKVQATAPWCDSSETITACSVVSYTQMLRRSLLGLARTVRANATAAGSSGACTTFTRQASTVTRQFTGDKREAVVVDDILAYREKPTSLSYFTGNYRYHDLLIKLESLYNEYARKAAIDTDAVDITEAANKTQEPLSWKPCDKMSQLLEMPLKASQWRKIVQHLNALASLPQPLPEPVKAVIEQFLRYDGKQGETVKVKMLDELGRAYAVGRRKESSARCWVVEGDGQVLVNGMTLEEYFKKPVDRDQVLIPLQATENLEKYNVWALVSGGGSTGKSSIYVAIKIVH